MNFNNHNIHNDYSYKKVKNKQLRGEIKSFKIDSEIEVININKYYINNDYSFKK
jgi:hypothetical protein